MSCRIYIIEDRHNLKYVGSTIQTLESRLTRHKYCKKHFRKITSSKLDLDNCEIKLLEICPIERRKEVEQYWIDRIDCVNKHRTIAPDKSEYNKERYEKNKEKLLQKNKIWSQKNKKKHLQLQKNWYEKNKKELNIKRKEYQKEYRENKRVLLFLETLNQF